MAKILPAAQDAARRGVLSARLTLLLHRPPPTDLRTIKARQDALAALTRINPPEGPRS